MAGLDVCRAWSPLDVDAGPSATMAAVMDIAATPFTGSVGNHVVAEAHGGSRELSTVAPGALAVGAEIGKGRFKRVHRGWHRRFGAVVVLRFDEGNDANELSILRRFHMQGGCQNIPKVLGLCGDRVVQEYALWGSLKAAVQDPDVQARLSPAHKRCVAAQIARAGSFLVDSRIVHADLSCRNILLFWLEEEPKFSIAKVSDFGLAVVLPEGLDFVQRKQPQATRWCSPETVAHLTLSHRSDVWAFGATLWELFSNGTAPWSRRSKRGDVAARLRDLAENDGAAEGGPDVSNDFPLARNACGSTVHNLVLSCLQADEHARPSFAKLQQSFEQISEVAQAPVSISPSESEDGGSLPTTSRKAPTVSTAQAPVSISTSESEDSDSLPSKDSESLPTTSRKASTVSTADTASLEAFQSAAHDKWHAEETAQDSFFKLDCTQAQEASTVLGDDVVTSESSSCGERSTCGALVEERLWRSACDASRPLLEQRLWSTSPAGCGKRHSQEYIVPLVQSTGKWVESKLFPPPDPDLWTLTTYVQPALRRQDFASSDEAWAAFSADKEPCVLRGPRGVEVAARAWVPSPLMSAS